MRDNNALHIPDGFVVRGGMLCPKKITTILPTERIEI